MSVCFNVGDELGRNDLNIFLVNDLGVPVQASSISYSLFFVDKKNGEPGVEVLVGPSMRQPVNPSVGEYYAAIQVPPGAQLGDYRIRWTFTRANDTEEQTVVQEFGVVNSEGQGAGQRLYSQCERDLIDKLRIMLRDNNPDRNYRFCPPEQETQIKKFNRVFGYVWEDYELLCYLELALDYWNMFPPETESIANLNILCRVKPVWRTAILWGAMAHAMAALSINWIKDEFDYSIGGISLSIDKSSKYQGMKDNAEQQFQTATEAKSRTVKFIRGLKQPKFGFGVRSSFGPNVGRGVLSPRSFV